MVVENQGVLLGSIQRQGDEWDFSNLVALGDDPSHFYLQYASRPAVLSWGAYHDQSTMAKPVIHGC
jgi:hypothetical protein